MLAKEVPCRVTRQAIASLTIPIKVISVLVELHFSINQSLVSQISTIWFFSVVSCIIFYINLYSSIYKTAIYVYGLDTNYFYIMT